MMGQVVELPNMPWRKRRMLRNATAEFLRSKELAEIRERHKVGIERDIRAVFGPPHAAPHV
jgi:hypothetical protein